MNKLGWVLATVLGIITVLVLGGSKANAQTYCSAACGQCTEERDYCVQTRQNEDCYKIVEGKRIPSTCLIGSSPGDRECWTSCCSVCDSPDGGTGPAPTLAPPGVVDDSGRSPNCAGGCGFEGCGCSCTEGDWGPWGACNNGWQVRYKNVCSQAEPAQEWQQCNSCRADGPAAPGLAGPANGATAAYGNPISLSWYDAPDQSRGERVFVPDGGCDRWAERNVNCRQECKRTNRRGECTRYDTVCDRETVCVNPSGHWTRLWYGYDWGKWDCVLSGSQDGQGSFAVYVNDQRLGTVGYAGDTLTSGRLAGFTVPANQMTPGNNTWKIVAEADTGSASSTVWSFTLGTPPPSQVSVSGTVYNGTGSWTNKCSGPGNPLDPDAIASSKVRVESDGQEGPVQGTGFYQVFNVTNEDGKIITLSGIDPEWNCNCPGNCQYTGAAIASLGATDWNFYVSNAVDQWAQVIGGHVHGQAGATVKIPTGNNFLIPASFTNNKSGAASKTNGGFNTLPGGLSPNWSLLTDKIDLSTWRYSYHRLWVRAGSPTTLLPGDGYNKPPAGFYRKIGNLDIDGGWTGLSGKTVIFVDGNVNIESKITLASASDFFAVIASGDISVDPTVGDAVMASPTSNDADLVGAFLANGDFNGGTNGSQTDKQLVIYGTVGADIDLDGGGRVSFQRDMGLNNAIGPGVAVIWNPNLLLNFPDELKDALTDWREVAP